MQNVFLRLVLEDLRSLRDGIIIPIGLIFVWPFTNAWKVARGSRDILPAREAIGWLAGLATLSYVGIATFVYVEKGRFVILFIGVYVAVSLVRAFIWTLLDFFKK